MDDSDDYESIPNAPSNITIPFQPTNVLDDAFSIISGGLAFTAIIAVNIGAGFVKFRLLSSVMSILGPKQQKILQNSWFVSFYREALGTNYRDDVAPALTIVNSVVCVGVLYFTAMFGFGDRGFVGSLWHAFVAEAIILAFLLVVELVVIGLYCCASMDWRSPHPRLWRWKN